MTVEIPAEVPAPIRAELTRLRAERVVHVTERERLLDQLRDADTNMRAALQRQRELAEQAAVTEDARRLADEAVVLRADLETVRRQRDQLRAELATTREERDRMRMALLDSEVALHRVGAPPSDVPADAEQRIVEAERRAAHYERELAATHRTVSWRVTQPLRAVRRRVPPQQ